MYFSIVQKGCTVGVHRTRQGQRRAYSSDRVDETRGVARVRCPRGFRGSASLHFTLRCERGAGLGPPGVISERLSRRVGRGSECSVVASITYTRSSGLGSLQQQAQLNHLAAHGAIENLNDERRVYRNQRVCRCSQQRHDGTQGLASCRGKCRDAGRLHSALARNIGEFATSGSILQPVTSNVALLLTAPYDIGSCKTLSGAAH